MRARTRRAFKLHERESFLSDRAAVQKSANDSDIIRERRVLASTERFSASEIMSRASPVLPETSNGESLRSCFENSRNTCRGRSAEGARLKLARLKMSADRKELIEF